MGNVVVAKVEGLEQLAEKLQNCDKKLRKQFLRKFLTKAGGRVHKSAYAKAPVRIAGTRRNIFPRALLRTALNVKIKTQRGGTMVALVGPKPGQKEAIGTYLKGPRAGEPVFEDPRNIAHLAENGTAHEAARPFMRPAFDENIGGIKSDAEEIGRDLAEAGK